MQVNLSFPGDMEAEVSAVGESRRFMRNLERIEVSPNFYPSVGKSPILYLVAYASDGSVLGKYVVTQSAVTGRLRMEDRTQPIVPKYEQIQQEISAGLREAGEPVLDDEEDEG